MFCSALPALNSSRAFGGLSVITKERSSITVNHTDVISGNADRNTMEKLRMIYCHMKVIRCGIVFISQHQLICSSFALQ